MKLKVILVACLAFFSMNAMAAVSADVESIISGSSLNALQKKSLNQYAESLDAILNADITNRDVVINTNKQFMNAQQCLAQIYSIDQKPDMMRVSRNIFNTTFKEKNDLNKYYRFLGQAQQEGDLALPNSAKACL